MFKRIAFFEGTIAPGREAEFDAYIKERLVPLWTQFPGATRVEVLREVEAEGGAHRYPLVLQTTYPERDVIEKALASKVRFESREMTKGLLAMFDGRVFHVVYEFDDHAAA
jgi:antibiotic biosynthesis monooxygenase (ABM) superfamily enzyme